MEKTSTPEPFFLPGNSTGCLLIHGFAGQPAEMQALGNYLATYGYTVLGIRLAGHASTPEALHATGWRDWLASAETGLCELRQHCIKQVVVGFSMGGALALLLATRQQYERLVLLATPLHLQGDWRIHVLPFLRFVMRWHYPLEQIDLDDPAVQEHIKLAHPGVQLDDPTQRQQFRRAAKISVAAIDELRKVLKRARACVPQITQPTLIMHGCDDTTAPRDSADELLKRLGGQHKQLIWWEQTGHQLVRVGPHRDAIFERIATFVAEQEHSLLPQQYAV